MNTSPDNGYSDARDRAFDANSSITTNGWAHKVIGVGMKNGECPVGSVEVDDGERLTLQLFSFVEGRFMRAYRIIEWAEVHTVHVAWAEHRQVDGEWICWIDTPTLGVFQDAWKVKNIDLRKVNA